MVRFKSKLTKKEQEELLIDFCRVLAEIKNPEEAAFFIKDLLSQSEAEMLAKRIQIARYLIQGMNYRDIEDLLKVSHGTIARVNTWLSLYGEGYRIMVERLDKNKKIEKNVKPRWTDIRRKYPSYYWPQLLLEEIIRNATRRQKEKIKNALSKLEEKTELYNHLSKLLHQKV